MSQGRRQEQIAPHGRTGGLSWQSVVAVLIGIVVVVFLLQNLESTTVNLLIWTPTLPLVVWLLLLFALGVLMSGLVRSGIRRVRGKDAKS